MSSLSMTASDTIVLARRNLMRIPRQPDLLIAYTVQPVMFTLLFVYVFGGAIDSGPFDYVDFLIPGIIVQSIAFGGFVTALGLSEDVQKGLIDRFRSLPMSRGAVLAGRTFSDIALNCLSLVVLFAVGFAAGDGSPARDTDENIVLDGEPQWPFSFVTEPAFPVPVEVRERWQGVGISCGESHQLAVGVYHGKIDCPSPMRPRGQSKRCADELVAHGCVHAIQCHFGAELKPVTSNGQIRAASGCPHARRDRGHRQWCRVTVGKPLRQCKGLARAIGDDNVDRTSAINGSCCEDAGAVG